MCKNAVEERHFFVLTADDPVAVGLPMVRARGVHPLDKVRIVAID